jgi:acyl-CoA thioesterase I
MSQSPHSSHRVRSLVLKSALAVMLLGSLATSSVAETKHPDICAVPRTLLSSSAKLSHFATKVAQGGPLKIVALGSSSTSGAGASSDQRTYPSRLEAELKQMFPRSTVAVLNRGVGGEQTPQMLARFQKDVLDEKPDLLIWQSGTNSALVGAENVAAYTSDLLRGIDAAHKAGIDVILMSPQFSPRFEAAPGHAQYVEHMAAAAAMRNVPVMRRYEVMRHWVVSGQMSMNEMIDADGLHLTDRSYACLGHAVAEVLVNLSHPIPPPAVTASR